MLPDAAGERRRRRTITLAVGLALLAACLAVTLSHPAKRRLGTNGLPARTPFALAGPEAPVCQDQERIPSGTAAIRVAVIGDRRMAPRLGVTLSEGEAVRAVGGRGARWDGRSAVLVPLAGTVRRDVIGSICISVGAQTARYLLKGVRTYALEGATAGGSRLPGRVHVEYIPGGTGSWWFFVPTIVQRMGLGHAWSGVSVPLLILVLALTSIALGAWQLVRER